MQFESVSEASEITEEFQTEERERLADAAGTSERARELAELLLLASLVAPSVDKSEIRP